MTPPLPIKTDPKLDLILERTIDVPPHLVWEAWTKPEHLKQWFIPKPWTVTDCELDVRPGGIFRTTMRSPEGEEFPNTGCYLEIVPGERIAFTDALQPGFRPAGESFMTAIITMTPEGAGTRYTAIALHTNEENRRKHEEMGFLEGWGTALDQLVALMKTKQ